MSTKITTEEIISSLDGIQRAEPKPFLYTRIRGRMANEDSGRLMQFFRKMSSPAFSLAIACLIIVVNGYFLASNLADDVTYSDESNQPIAAEYVQIPDNPYVSSNENP